MKSVLRRCLLATGASAIVLAAAAPASAMHTKLLGYWQLNEGSGQTALDASEHLQHGTLGSQPGTDDADPSWVTSTAAGHRAVSLAFDGGDYVGVPDSKNLEPGDVTVEAWVRSSGPGPGPFRYILAKGAIQCVAASYGLYTGRDGGLMFYVSDQLQYTLSPAAAPARVWDGKWHHVAGTYGAWDRNRVRLYVDGTQVGTGTPSDISPSYGFPNNDDLHIGSYLGDCRDPMGFVGGIDNVRVWNVAMTAGDVSLLAQGG